MLFFTFPQIFHAFFFMPRLQTTVLTLFKQNSGIIFEESPMKHIPPMHSMKAGSSHYPGITLLRTIAQHWPR